MPRFNPNKIVNDCYSSVGNVTFFHINGVCYWKKRAKPVFPATAGQLAELETHRRAISAWREVSDSDKLAWRKLATDVYSHRPPMDSDNHISGYNLFVSAYHGFVRLGNEHVPAPQAFDKFPDFFVKIVNTEVTTSTDLQITLTLDIPGCREIGRFRLMGRLQLTASNRSYSIGKMRNFLAEEVESDSNGNRLVRFTIANYRNVWGIDLTEYNLHCRLMLIDSLKGYRGQNIKLLFKVVIYIE